MIVLREHFCFTTSQLCVSGGREVDFFRVRSRSRTSSTRATHVDARTKSFGARIRGSDLLSRVRASSSLRSPCRARVWLLVGLEPPRSSVRRVTQADSTPDAPREHDRGTPRWVPTISTCIRVTPTTSRVRFLAARVSSSAPSHSSDSDD